LKRITVFFILFFTTSSVIFSQFYTEAPILNFDVDFGNDSFGILRYNCYRPTEKEFWTEIITGAYFQYQIDPPESLIPRSYTEIENNVNLDEYVKTTMKRNNITVCETFFANDFGGFTYVVNYSFDNYKTFGFISMSSTGYESPSAKTVPQQVTPSTVPKYKIITGRADTYGPITQDELRKRINLQSYNDIVSWLRYNSHNVVESSGVTFDRMVTVLVNNFKMERNNAENSLRNIGNNSRYHWLYSGDRVTEWIVFIKE
jgi:hypothetical protein